MKKLILSLFIFTLFMIDELEAQDWANLAQFKDANVELGAPKIDEERVVFMGNSITIGWLQLLPSFFDGKPYVNRGISGQTTPQMLLRFRQDVISLDPKVVVILAGTNDIAGNTGPITLEMILDNIKSMTELAEANDISVVISSVLPAFDYPWRTGKEPNKKIPALNAMLKDYAEKKGVVYLDYFSAMEDGNNGMIEAYGSDGVHPNAKGYEVMSPLVEKAIQQALNKK
ncbi:SGNH/GDSL hydrolase family protein [Spongiimicrobium sp. 3-5]|uniref:SGNH/GDSL hydrolase family protein n=1 Tax=Spongiimicrobium sp. 3-5 TaxID=3332596 RepID=UPI0039808238